MSELRGKRISCENEIKVLVLWGEGRVSAPYSIREDDDDEDGKIAVVRRTAGNPDNARYVCETDNGADGSGLHLTGFRRIPRRI